MRLDRATHRAVLALWAKVEINDDTQLAGRRTEKALDTVHDDRRAGRSFGIGCPSNRLMHSDHIRIGRVGALATPVAPHRDKDKVCTLLAPAFTFFPLGDGEGTEDCGIRGICDRVAARIDTFQEVVHRATRQLTGTDGSDSSGRLGSVLVTVNEGRNFPS